MYSVISVKLDSLPANTGARQAAALHRSLTRVSTDYSQPAVPWISTLFPLFPRSDVSSFWDRILNGNRVRSLHKRENVKSDLRKRNQVVSSQIFGGRHPISEKMKMGGKADTIRGYCGPPLWRTAARPSACRAPGNRPVRGQPECDFSIRGRHVRAESWNFSEISQIGELTWRPILRKKHLERISLVRERRAGWNFSNWKDDFWERFWTFSLIELFHERAESWLKFLKSWAESWLLWMESWLLRNFTRWQCLLP